MLNFKSVITYYLSSTATDMRKGREGLAGVVREALQRDPYNYGEAFIFYSKDLRKVKILHYDINGFVIYSKWFDDGRFLSPYFREARQVDQDIRSVAISHEQWGVAAHELMERKTEIMDDVDRYESDLRVEIRKKICRRYTDPHDEWR